MDIRKLEYFVMTCTHMNMTKAAQALHISQPSLSSAIMQLETDFGFEVFDRSHKQLRMTQKGEIALKRAKSLLEHYENVHSEMIDLGRNEAGEIKLGVPPMIGTLIFPGILTAFGKDHADLSLMISEEGSLEMKRKIAEGEVDIGIIILSEEDARLEFVDLLETEIVVCISKEHKLNSRSAVTAADIARERLIMLKEGFYHREALMSYFHRKGIDPHIAVSTNQLKTLESLVSENVGISFLFKELASDNDKMNWRPMADPMYIKIGVAWRKDFYLTVAMRDLIAFLKETNM